MVNTIAIAVSTCTNAEFIIVFLLKLIHFFQFTLCYYSEPSLDSASLHLDMAARHMKFQKKLLIHASMIRIFSSISHGSE